MPARALRSNIFNVAADPINELLVLRRDLLIERDARADDVRALSELNRRITAVQNDLKNSQRDVIEREDLLAAVGKAWGEPHEGCPNLNSDVCYEPNCFDGHLVEVKS